MAIAITLWDHTLDTSPGATSQSSASAAYTAGYTYLVCVTQYRTDSTNPATPSVAGMGATWSDISGAGELWDTDGASRRRTSLFIGSPETSGSGSLSVSYATAPADIDIMVVQCAGAASASVQVVGAAHTATNGTLAEPGLGLASPGDTANRFITFVAGNVNAQATARLELSTDTGGDADWTTLSVEGSGSSPTGVYLCGFLDDDPNTDVTPGWINTTANSSSYMIVVEVSVALTSSTLPYLGVRAIPGSNFVVDPPSSYSLLVGASCQIISPATTYAEATAQFESDCGVSDGTMIIGRRYHSNFTTNFSGHAAFAQDIGKRHRCISLKQSGSFPTQADFESLMSTIPEDGYTTWVMNFHEPEDNVTSSEFTTQQARLHAAWVAAGRSDIKPGWCTTGYQDRDGNASTGVQNYSPGSGIIGDFAFWVDNYDPNGNKSLEEQCTPSFDAAEALGADPLKFAVGETGTQRTDAATATWIHEGCDWLRSISALGILWWNSQGGAAGPWDLTRSLERAAWGEEMQQSRDGL